MYKNKNAITLVELIITITLLVILWVVWFLSFISYMVSVRDSSRVIELWNIESVLWWYVLKSWFYPEPTDFEEITYSWSIVWNQWKFWNSVSSIISYSQDVLDPLTNTEYAYSVKNSRWEYQIAWVLEETPGLVSSNLYIDETYAWKIWVKDWTAIVRWNYNWEVISVTLNWINNILAVPSIIASNLSSLDLGDIMDNNRLVYDGFNNLPATYTWTIYDLDKNIDFSPNTLLVFSWSISNLTQAHNQVILLQEVQKAYSWSLLWNLISVNRIDPSDLFSAEPSSKIVILACDLINFKIKYFAECWGIDFITFFVINVLHIDITNLPWNQITTVFQDADWNYVFWTNHWLSFHDWTEWITYTKQNSDLVRNFITSVTQDNNWDYWIWTDNWISKLEIGDMFEAGDDIWTTFDKDILFKSHIQYIYTDSDWVVWIWTNQWVTAYNWDVWSDYTAQTSWLTHDNITAIYNDSNWYVWFWTNSQWVDRYTILDWSVVNYNSWDLPDHRVSYIFEATNWDVWVWTEWWIWKTSDSWTTWSSFTTSNWLVDNVVTYIFESTTWEIWIWTKWWLSMYDWVSWTNYETSNADTSKKLTWDNVYLVYEDETQSIIVFNDWWVDTIDSLWNIIP